MLSILKLATKYGSDNEITRLVDGFDWKITPVTNPDGYTYSWTTVLYNDYVMSSWMDNFCNEIFDRIDYGEKIACQPAPAMASILIEILIRISGELDRQIYRALIHTMVPAVSLKQNQALSGMCLLPIDLEWRLPYPFTPTLNWLVNKFKKYYLRENMNFFFTF